nr:hypothetical protein [Anaerolineae bacterium]
MTTDRMAVLRMLEEGAINTDEAARLLLTLSETEEADAEVVIDRAPVAERLEMRDMPDISRIRGFWRYPFYVAVGVLIACGLLLGWLYSGAEGRLTFWLFCVWNIFTLAALACVLAVWSRAARWLHLRVTEKDGKKIAISLPLPLSLTRLGLRIASRYVDDSTGEQLLVASEFLEALQSEKGGLGDQPLVVNVDDDDGDKVSIYIG